MKRLKVGVVGCGFAANHHINAWRKNGAEVVAVSDIVEDKARSCASRYDIPSYFASLDEMLEKVKLDAVSLCTPPQTHKLLALKAIRSGVHVFSEKPLTLSYADAVEIVREAEANNVKVWVTMNYIFTPTMVKARELVEKGLIGKLRRVDVVVYTPQEVILSSNGGWLSTLPGGAFGEVLPHPIYVAQRLLGKLKLVSAHYEKLSKSKWMKYDELHALLEGEKGLGRIIISYNASWFDFYVLAEGSKGMLIANPTGKLLVRLGRRYGYLSNILSIKPYLRLALDYVLGRVTRNALAKNIEVFIKHIREGEPLDPSIDLVLNQVEVYEEILQKYNM